MYAETRPATGHPSYGRVDFFLNSGITVGSPDYSERFTRHAIVIVYRHVCIS